VQSPQVCPVCRAGAVAVEQQDSQIERELEIRSCFVKQRLGHKPSVSESMDLTRFMHGGPARFVQCVSCGTLLREEDCRAQYEADLYDSALMRHLYPRYLRAFQEKQSTYYPLLRNGAEVLEVGSHLGGFLQAAEEWGWRPTGVDIGHCTSAFARKQGATVKRISLENYSPRLRNPEAIFIWNCFEQLEDPVSELQTAHRLLDRHGLLVVRVPNAAFYREQRRRIQSDMPGRSLKLLAYNNLLGFPYLHGYTSNSLHRLLRANRFEPVATRASSLLTPPYPDVTRTVRNEWREVQEQSESSAAAGTVGPWIEIISRRVAAI